MKPTMKSRTSEIVLSGLLVAWVAGGCGGGGGASGAHPDASAAADGGSFAMSPCAFPVAAGAPITCGFVTVPEDHSKPEARRVRLAIAIVKAVSPSAAPPLVYLAGGPGGSGIGEGVTDGALSEKFRPFAPGRDLIFVDQRGTGASEPSLACPESKPMTMAPSGGMMPGSLSPSDRTAVMACRARLVALGVDLSKYDSASSADDLELVRRALGIARWDVLGVSYGTRLALELMRRQPAGLRTVVLDSVLPTQTDAIAENPTGVYRALDLIFKNCEAGGCGPDNLALRATFLETVSDIARSPVPLSTPGKTFTAEKFVKLVSLLLYDEKGGPLVPGVVAVVRARRIDALEQFVATLEKIDSTTSFGLHLSVMCREYVAFSSRAKAAAELAKVPAELRPYLNNENYFEACDLWNVPAASASVRDPVTSALPTLVLAGNLDPATPPAWSKLAAMSLSAAHYFEISNVSHGVFGSECGVGVINQFLAKPALRPVQASCMEQ